MFARQEWVWMTIVVFLLVGPGKASATTAPMGDSTTSTLPPAEMTSFTIYIADSGAVREEVSAEIGYLYQQLGIAHLRRIHVDFLEKGSGQKDTLDAPEGYLYTRDFSKDQKGDTRIGPTFPFYKQIGGKEANIDLATTSTRLPGGLPEEVVRYRNDIDLIGTEANRIVYRRSDGNIINCLRAYRDAKNGKIWTVGNCELRGALAGKSQDSVIKGKVFIGDDQLKNITIRGAPYLKGTADQQPRSP